MSSSSSGGVDGTVEWELRGPDGKVKKTGRALNVITQIGDQVYGERGGGISGAPAVPTGMKLGTQASPTTPAKTGAAAALETYLTDSHLAFDATYPQSAVNAGLRRITYKCTYAAGKATSASAITEAVIVNETLTNATSAVAATVSRVLLSGVGSKAAADSLTLTWTHDIGS